MNLRARLQTLADRVLAVLLVAIVAGMSLAFGGAVWWAKPALAAATLLAVLAGCSRMILQGRWRMLKSPLSLIGLMAVGLACVQVFPMPGRVAERLSPRSRAVHAVGGLPDRVHADDPNFDVPGSVAARTPSTLDRSATLRWIAGAMACLALFWLASHFADRLRHSALLWGSVVGVFFVGTAFAAVQLLGGSSGLYGAIEPGSGRPGMPSLDDLRNVPNVTMLRPVGDARGGVEIILARPDQPFQLGTLLGGPGSYLAIASLGLPLAMGLALQILAPRGSREGLRQRLRDSGMGGVLGLLVGLTLVGSLLVGYLAGPILAAPFALAMVVIGVPSAWPSGLKWVAIGFTALSLSTLCGGATLGEVYGRPRGSDLLASRGDLAAVREVWSGAARVARDFPLVGAGLGAYATISPYYKATDETSTTAQNSLLQWWAEAGLAGMAILGLGALWCLVRLPGSIRRVGSAESPLAWMLLGVLACFTLFSALHWTVELLAVAVAACAVMGTCNRWLAGGTDLFVERA